MFEEKFRKKHIDVEPKVAAALGVLYELKIGSKYDYIYHRPLSCISIYEVPKRTRDPMAITGIKGGGETSYSHPRDALALFQPDYINWFSDEKPSPDTSDRSKYDGVSNEYVLLHHNYSKNWVGTGRKGMLWVGLTLLPEQEVEVNSYGLCYMINKLSFGHTTILLPQQY